MANNYILPFLWMKGESKEVIAKEIEKIDECGIKAICLESRPHPDFMGPQWWDDFGFIVEEAKKRDMRIWILDDAHFPTGYANGLVKSKYPERKKRYINYNVVNVWGKTGAITVNVGKMTKPLVSFLELDKPMDFAERAKNKLISVVAFPLREGKKIDETGAINLISYVKDGVLTYQFPQDNYRIFVVYETATDGGNADYVNMMDKESVSTLIEAVYEPHYAQFKEEFGKTIAGFFSDEPEIGNTTGFSSEVKLGQCKMALPWSEALKSGLEAIYGEEIYNLLPMLWNDTMQMKACTQVRHSFMDVASDLYRINFSEQLGDWCAAHNVEYIGHVVEDGELHQRLGQGAGHFFRAMSGQHMAGIDAISDQIIPGEEGYTRSGIFQREGTFYHYTLAKMGASAGHLDPKKQGRTMCELFGASGWETGVRNMKYILDHLLARGINYLVPHAFSMAEYPDHDCPPHFYARGKNPQFKYFAQLMKYANRMCDKLNGGAHKANVAVLYTAEADWCSNTMYMDVPLKALQQSQIECDVVCADMLVHPENYNGKLDDEGLWINGQCFTHLVIPAADCLTKDAYDFICANPAVEVIFLDKQPQMIVGTGAEAGVCVSVLQQALANTKVMAAADLGAYLREKQVGHAYPVVPFKDLVYYHYEKDGDIHVFHNEGAFATFLGEIALPLKGNAVYYDGMTDTYYKLPVRKEGEMSYVTVEIAPFGLGMILDVAEAVDNLPAYATLSEIIAACKDVAVLEGPWNYACAKEEELPTYSKEGTMETLMPYSDIDPAFSGHIAYSKEVVLDKSPAQAYLEFTEVYEAVELWINDVCVGSKLYPPYVLDVTGYLKEGANTIKAIATCTLDRDQMNFPDPFILLDYHVSEPSGLAGEVKLYTCE